MVVLRQSTAGQEILIGPILDSTVFSAETGLTIANTDILIWKNGATTLPAKNSGGATHISNGIYYAVLDATDTATVGSMEVHLVVAGTFCRPIICTVLAATVYDVLITGSANFSVNLVADQSAATVGTVTTVTSAGLSAAAVDAIWDEVVTAHTDANSAGENLNVINDMLTGKKTVSGTTMTHFKQDGTSTRKAFTLDNATNASSRVPV